MEPIPSIEKVLMNRDGLTWTEAREVVQEAREDLHDRLEQGELVDDAEFCKEWFSLEPDFIMQLF